MKRKTAKFIKFNFNKDIEEFDVELAINNKYYKLYNCKWVPNTSEFDNNDISLNINFEYEQCDKEDIM